MSKWYKFDQYEELTFPPRYNDPVPNFWVFLIKEEGKGNRFGLFLGHFLYNLENIPYSFQAVYPYKMKFNLNQITHWKELQKPEWPTRHD